MNADKLVKVITAVVVVVMLMNVAEMFTAESAYEPAPPSVSSYLTAYGDAVELNRYFGNHLWVDYAATWCSYCDAQTGIIKALMQQYGSEVDFLTVVIGTDKVMQPPAAGHARDWADRHGLDPDHVLAYFSTETLPYHILYSPGGEVLYRGSGLHRQARIASLLDQHLPWSL